MNKEMSKQLEKVMEELEELQVCRIGDVDHIIEELADCYVSLNRLKNMIINKYNFSIDELKAMMYYKNLRTERRFRDGYYEN